MMIANPAAAQPNDTQREAGQQPHDGAIAAGVPVFAEGVTKRFGRRQVLAGIDLAVPRGSIFGFLGLNGAGKTTLIHILLGLIQRDAGRCRVLGLDPSIDAVAVRAHVGYMAENQNMYGWMRVRELIRWVGCFHADWDAALAEQLRTQMGLNADEKVAALSRGQTSKLALLLALANRPELVILDDPVLGLDPLARRDFLRDVIGQLQARAVTVLFSSHLLYEIEPICDHVAILHDGRIAAAGPVEELRARVKRIELRTGMPARLVDVPGLLDVRPEGNAWSVAVEDPSAALSVLREMSDNGVAVVDLTLDEIFEAFVAGRREVRT